MVRPADPRFLSASAPAAEEGRPARRRTTAVLLGAVVAVGLARGLFWVAVTEVPNPIDEHAHFAYVESMARRFRPPVVGEDRLSAEALQLVKRTQTSFHRSVPLVPDPSVPGWNAVAESYEGVQGPLYYALMALPYRLAHPLGVLTSLYAVRVATVLLSLLAVPVAYLLARELFPRQRAAWVAAPALLVVLQGFNANLGSITNDALVVPLGGATLLAVARARRSGLTPGTAVVTGLLLGLGLATKSNMIALFPLVAVAAVAVAAERRQRWTGVVRWGGLTGLAAAVAAAPWLAWNLVTYGSPSAADEVDRITGPLQPRIPRTLAGLREHVADSTAGFWDSQLAGRSLGRYMWLLSLVALALVAVAVAVSLRRRRVADAASLAWLGSAVLVTLATMLFVIFVVFAGRSSVVGRHLYPALVATVVVVGVAAFVVAGARAGWVVVAAVAAVALTMEVDTDRRYVDLAYTAGLFGALAPVVEQTWADGRVATPVVEVMPPCAAEAVALGFTAPAVPPAALAVTTALATVDAPLVAEHADQATRLFIYRLPVPIDQPFSLATAGLPLAASGDDREPHLALPNEPGDPVARVFCPVADPKRYRFAQRFPPDHPSWITYDQLRAWPVAWAWAARLAVLGLAAAFVVDLRRRRRAGAPEAVPGPPPTDG